MTKTTYNVETMKQDFEMAYLRANDSKSRKAYAFAIELLNSLPNNEHLEVRRNPKTNTYNIGDIGEIVVKYHINNDSELSYSYSNQVDINRTVKNEIKTFSSANRYPNGLHEPEGFYSVSEYGVHYITKELVIKYWNEFRDHKGTKQPTLKVLKDIITNEQPNQIEYLTNKIFN